MKPGLFSLFLLTATLGFSDERILSFHSDIEIHADNTLTVTETINVRAEGKQIKRGIFRKFPTNYKDRLGGRMWVKFDVLEVTRDGKSEPYHIKKEGKYEVVYMGKADRKIPTGEYEYAITYKTDRQIGFFDDHDELYYNITGNEWAFKIDAASATITPPEGVTSPALTAEAVPGAVIPEMKLEAYTGPSGAKGKDYVREFKGGKAFFRTSKPLNEREGLTVVVSFPKGFVTEPTLADRLSWLLVDDPCSKTAVIGALVMLGYLVIVWAIVGQDPKAGTIIPQFFPPKEISPAGARYIMRMKYDDRCFAAALINLGVKGWIRLAEKPGRTAKPEYQVERRGEEGTERSAGETVVYKKLLGIRSQIRLTQSNHSSIGAAVAGLQKALKKEFDKKYFAHNSRYLFPAILILLATLGVTVLFAKDRETAGFMSLWLSIWTIAVIFLGKNVITQLGHARRGGNMASALFGSLFALPFFIGELVGVGVFAHATSIMAAVMLLVMAVTITRFNHLLKAPTMHGRKILDHLEGFRLYLSVAERDRLQAMQGPEKTPELFEAYLPYALALGVEQQWAEQFTAILAHANAGGGGGGGSGSSYSSWYSSTSSGSNFIAPAALAGAVSGALAAAVAASSTAPGSSSGGGGGGSSGGGGGGGGGGGW